MPGFAELDRLTPKPATTALEDLGNEISGLKAENERLRGLIQEAVELLEEKDLAADNELYWRMRDATEQVRSDPSRS